MNLTDIIENIILLKKSNEIISEEATKQYLIYPFLMFLGYDIYSPAELKYEFECDMHENGSRRVDCVVLGDDAKPLIIIEAKAFGKDLNEFLGQIKSYFVSSGALYAFLTDGNKYFIFEKSQVDGDFYMALPKFSFLLDGLKKEDLDIIKSFAKINLKQIFSIEDNKILNEERYSNTSIQEVESGIVLSDKDGVEKFIERYSDIEGKSVESIYSFYLKYVKEKGKQVISVGKFETVIKERLSMRISVSGGVKYFIRENTIKDDIENFIAKYSDIEGKPVDSVYYSYTEYMKDNKRLPVSVGKFESAVKEILLMKISFSGGVKYFINEYTSEKIINDFISSISLNDLYGATCDEVFRQYKDYCNNCKYYTVTKNVFCRTVVTINSNVIINKQNKNGINIDCFERADKLKKLKISNTEEWIPLSDSEKSFFKYCNMISIDDIKNKITREAYLEYLTYCEENHMSIINHIDWSRKIKRFFSVKIKSKNIDGKTRRIFYEI